MSASSEPDRLILTTGEPAGIGPELTLMAALRPHTMPVVALGDPALLRARAKRLGIEVPLHEVDHPGEACQTAPHALYVVPVHLRAPVTPGQLDPNNAAYVIETLDLGAKLAQEDPRYALVTCPVQKSVINEAGHAFTGHTEFFAEAAGVERVVMMLATEGLRVALATTHLPLREVADAITQESLETVLRITLSSLRRDFGIDQPSVVVAGLNPHAGEGGHLGREEIDIINPVLNRLRAAGEDLVGPLPADTLFTPKHLEGVDAVLAMYHDQGLPVLKYKGFGAAANITLGLPFIRSSVDHGTALDLAGTGRADPGSLFTAIQVASDMLRGRRV